MNVYVIQYSIKNVISLIFYFKIVIDYLSIKWKIISNMKFTSKFLSKTCFSTKNFLTHRNHIMISLGSLWSLVISGI